MTIRAYLSRTSLAEQLDVAPSTVDELVKRGVLPRPIKLSSGCVRWSWARVEAALASLAFPTETEPADPYIEAARHAKAEREKRRGSP
jgi:predicted DNA-binding transcriptional regulator AlpA